MDILEPKKVIYTAQSRHLFYCRMLICKYVLENDGVPLNPFNVWGYFLYELVDRDLVRRGNNNIVRIVDETWVFGPIADGVLAEIDYTIRLGKPLKFFSAGSKYTDISPLNVDNLIFEPEALVGRSETDLKKVWHEYMRGFE